MENTTLDKAVKTLDEKDTPVLHNNIGCHHQSHCWVEKIKLI